MKQKNKLGFIDGTCIRPNDNTVLAKQWDRCNSVVLSWILSSVTEELFLGQVFSKISSQVWSELKETYDKVDGSVTFNLHTKINSSTQNGSPVSDYYHRLNSLWKQFDALVKLPACTCSASHEFSKHNQLLKLMQFLMGLDDVYLPIRSSILTSDPLPTVKTAFSIISREESHRGVSGSCSNKTQSSAFFSKIPENKKKIMRPSNLVCKHCGVTGHTIERCFKLNGFPKDFKPSASNTSVTKSSNSNPSSSVSQPPSSSVTLTEDQVAKLLSLLEQRTINEVSANMAGTSISSRSSWIIDSGENQHMTSSVSNLENVVDISDLNLIVNHPNGSKAKIKKIGNLKLTNDVVLFDVLVVPDFRVNLLSVHKLARDNKLFVGFDENRCYVQDSHRTKLVGTGSEEGGLYFFDIDSKGKSMCSNVSVSCFVSYQLWHSRLGHPAYPVLNVLKERLNIGSETSSPCEICHKAKQSRTKFGLSEHKSKEIGELVHLDIWGPYKVNSRDGFTYFLTVVDDFSRSVWVYLLKGKDEVYENMVVFCNLLQTQFGKVVKIFRSDNGSEFLNQRVNDFMKSRGIVHQTSCVYTPQQNGVVERKHIHLLNVSGRCSFEHVE